MTKKLNVSIKPSSESIQDYLNEWEQSSELAKYRVQEEALQFLFNEICPRHDCLKQVIIKVSTLNDFYSTNIFDTFAVAKHIVKIKDINERLQDEDLKLVNEIASVPGRPYYYSFATKYCHHHKPSSFPIYDYYVAEMLKYFRRENKSVKFKNEELKDYSKLVEIIKDYKSYYDTDNKYSLRDIDKYLWQAGKKNFPRYKKSTTSNK